MPERFDVVTIDEENETTCKMVFSQLEEALANSALIVAEVKVRLKSQYLIDDWLICFGKFFKQNPNIWV